MHVGGRECHCGWTKKFKKSSIEYIYIASFIAMYYCRYQQICLSASTIVTHSLALNA